MNSDQKMTKARSQLVIDSPFFGVLALKMRVSDQPDVPTMATDGKSIFYNPEWVDGLPLEQIKGVIAHEVLHVANGHHLRRDGREIPIWNQSCDYAINPILRDGGFDLPPCGFYREDFHGLSAEEIFSRLISEQPEEESEPGAQGKSGDPGVQSDPDPGENPVSGSGEGQNSENPENSDDPEEKPDDPEDSDPPADPPSENPKKPDSGVAWGEVLDAKNPDGSEMSQAEIQQEISQLGTDVIQAIQHGKNQGVLPGNIERMIRADLEPIVRWENVLKDFFANLQSEDWSWSRPSRRFVSQGVYLPGTVKDRIDEIVIAVDTSGSIDRDALDRAGSEINRIMDSVRPGKIRVIYCDEVVQGAPEEFHEGEEIVFNAKGGGGTDFRPTFEWVRENGLDIQGLIYFTDLQCNSYPDADPGFPVLWMCSGREESPTRNHYGLPPFGETLFLG